MKKYLVIGNPVQHSLSPKLHNYWFNQNNIEGVYEKKKLTENNISDVIKDIRNSKIEGVNVTVPFKKSVIPFIDHMEHYATKTQSVNTIFKRDGKIIGDNTDIKGFKYALEHIKYNVKGKKILILGAGGVTSSIIYALEQMEASNIMLSNRTAEKAENLKKQFPKLELIKWGTIKNFDMIINATSLGLNISDKIDLNFDQFETGKFFYDVIYNPRKTSFLSKAEKRGHQIENGKMMFVYQAALAFEIWTGVKPQVNKNVIELLEND